LRYDLSRIDKDERQMGQFGAAAQVIGKSLSDWWYAWVNLALINVVWALCCASIVLAPPATLGLFYAANQLAHGHTPDMHDFIAGARRYFLRSWLWAALNVAVAVLTWTNFRFYSQLETDWAALPLSLSLMIAVVWILTQFYALPFLIEQDQKKLRVALRNGLFTALASPLFTFVVGGFAVLAAVISGMLVALLFLGGPALIALLGNNAVLERLETFGVRQRPQAQPDQPQDDR
jgi:uncharacterized membrane protein YesL